MSSILYIFLLPLHRHIRLVERLQDRVAQPHGVEAIQFLGLDRDLDGPSLIGQVTDGLKAGIELLAGHTHPQAHRGLESIWAGGGSL
jgi:hypothetical protein